jgi:hypothetical protein
LTAFSYTFCTDPATFQFATGFEPFAPNTSTATPPWKVLSLHGGREV